MEKKIIVNKYIPARLQVKEEKNKGKKKPYGSYSL